jgi:hypothetical protein
MVPSEGLRKEIISGLFLTAGIYSIVHGLTAEKFAFRSKAWKPGEEKSEFVPGWKDRLLIVFVGIVVGAVSLYSLLTLTRGS